MSTSPPLPTISEIKDRLSGFVIPDIKDKTKLEQWLKMLIEDISGQVLCINLYIDLKNDCLDKSTIADIIDNMLFPDIDARWAFYKYVEAHQDQVLFNHQDGPQLLKNDQYVRIMSIIDMIDYYLRQPLKLPSLTYEAEQEVLERFIYAPEERKEKLGIVKEIWRGKMMNVWVTSKSDLDKETFKVSKDEIANTVRDRLGFSGLHTGKLVCIIYPIDFDRAQVYIPTTIDANSGSLYYISAVPKERWGMSCCLTSLNAGLKERSHTAFEGGLTDDFEMRLLGEITNMAEPDLNHLLTEALNRATQDRPESGRNHD